LKGADAAVSVGAGREPATLAGAAKIVFWGLVFWGGDQLAAGAFERNELAMAMVQAALADWGAGRMAISWSDPSASPATWNSVARRAARGAAFGFGAAGAVAVVALFMRSAVVFAGTLVLTPMIVGLVIAALGAVRDELLLRGVVLGATRLLPVSLALLACGAAAAAARLGTDGVVTSALVPSALRGVALGALWVRDRGAWMACGANTAWTWMTGPIFGGGLLDVRFASSAGADGVPGLAVLAIAAVLASLWAGGGLRAARWFP
jgi:hypothetical protein